MPNKIKLDKAEKTEVDLFLRRFKELMDEYENKPLCGIEKALYHYIQTSYQQFMCVFSLYQELNKLEDK